MSYRRENPTRFVIVGGGLAGWAMACGLVRSVQGLPVSVLVVEATTGVNVEPVQYTLPETLTYFQRLGLDQVDLLRETASTIRLGTRLLDWPAPGHSVMRGFGAYGARIGFLPFHQFVAKMHARGDEVDYATYSPTAVAALRGRFRQSTDGVADPAPELTYGLQLNTDKLTETLKARAVSDGADAISAEPAAVVLDSETGFVSELLLADGRRCCGDFFVDASRGRAVLFDDTLNVARIDWSRWLPCSRVVSATVRDQSEKPPYVTLAADDQGWFVQSALRHRIAWQYLFPPGSMHDDAARERLLARVNVASADALTMDTATSGHRERFWVGNCLAIGHCAGHVEALEVANLHLVQSMILRFLELLPSSRMEPRLAEEYNRRTLREHESLRDFVLLCYVARRRQQGFAWQSQAAMALPESLETRIRLFESRGRFTARDDEPVGQDGWVSMLLAAGIWPEKSDPLLDAMDYTMMRRHFDRMCRSISDAVDAMPSHGEFLAAPE